MQLGIFSEYRGMGLGTELLKFADEFAVNAKVSSLNVQTSASSGSVVAFYKKSGFVPIAIIPDVFAPDDGMVYLRKVYKNSL